MTDIREMKTPEEIAREIVNKWQRNDKIFFNDEVHLVNVIAVELHKYQKMLLDGSVTNDALSSASKHYCILHCGDKHGCVCAHFKAGANWILSRGA